MTRMQQRPEWAELLWFLLLVLSLGMVFGWHFAAMPLVLWLIGYVALWAHALQGGEKETTSVKTHQFDECLREVRKMRGGIRWLI